MTTRWTVQGMCSIGELLKKQQVQNAVRKVDLRARTAPVSSLQPAMATCGALGCGPLITTGFAGLTEITVFDYTTQETIAIATSGSAGIMIIGS